MRKIWVAILGVICLPLVGVLMLLTPGSVYNTDQQYEQMCGTQTQGVAYQPTQTTINTSNMFKEPEQIANAKIVIGVGISRGDSKRDIEIGLMTAMQESKLRNTPVGAGDRDSGGLFQQRPSQGWGTAEQVEDPVYASNKFFDRLEQVKNRDSMSLIDAAVAVQQPDKRAYLGLPPYDPSNKFMNWETPAERFLSGVSIPQSGSTTAGVLLPADGCGESAGDVEVAVQAALSQQGKPYVWGGESLSGFDCSGLVQWAYEKAGAKLPRVAADQYKAGPAIPKPGNGTPAEWLKVLKRGDLVFWSLRINPTASNISHVAIYLGDGKIIDAPHTGANIAVRNIFWDTFSLNFYGATRPIAESSSGNATHDGWQWPLKKVTESSPYGMRFHPILHVWRLHNGVDFVANMDTPVYAAHAGTVTYVGYDNGGGGNIITIDHGGGIQTIYMHLDKQLVHVGQKVNAGTQIALSGNTGGSTGPHLHFTVKVNGAPTDPIPFMRKFGLTL